MRQAFLISFGALLTICSANSRAWASGEESFGNQPLNAANYQAWPGIMPVVNHKSRVYHRWINGNEHCYFRGDNELLGDALGKFSAMGGEVREVVLRPKPATVQSFDRSRTFEFNWSLHLVGGVAKSLTKKDQGANIWSKHPIMTVYVGGDIQLDKIKIPAGVKVLELADLEKRYSKGLKSTDITVRGWGAGQLAQLDPYNKGNMEVVAKLLQDDDNWVRLNAASALASFGKKAEALLPSLRKALNTEDQRLQTKIKETIGKIEKATDRAAAEKEHREILAKISQFRKALAN